jgi:hypothetical protein
MSVAPQQIDKRICAMPVFIVVAMALLLLSETDSKAQTYFGAGGTPCSMVTFVSTGSQLYSSQSQWALGYVSGLNAAWKVTNDSDPLGMTDADHALNHVQRYCTDNPEHSLSNAVTDWFGSLPK